jgi:hypothetical protein
MARRAISSNIGKVMTKLLTALLALAMAVHLIKPLNLPGLRRRPDFWRIAVIAFAIWTIALLVNEVF